MALRSDVYIDHLRRDADRMGQMAEGSELSAPVPGCPGWDLHDLLGHTGAIHRWTTEILRRGSRERISRRELAQPPEGAAVIQWFRQGARDLASELDRTDPDAEAWNWAVPVEPTRFWFRRQAHETAVHRWDAESVLGTTTPVDHALAVDGIDELLHLFLPRSGPSANLGGSLHIHSTDGDGEWTVRREGEGLVVDPGHGKGDAAVRGTASDLLLFLWGRPVGADVQLFGDATVPARWRSHLRF